MSTPRLDVWYPIIGGVTYVECETLMCRLHREYAKQHPGLLWGSATLPAVARFAGSDDVVPGLPTTLALRFHVIEREVLEVELISTIATQVVVSGVDVRPGERDCR